MVFQVFSVSSKNNIDNVNLMQSMNSQLIHRGPDDYGVLEEIDNSCILAHRRLSIVDLSPTGKQPMVSKSTRYVISYNGEVYNTKELNKILIENNIYLRGHSDTEIILELCEFLGIQKTLKKLIGMFAFALYDRKEKNLFM